MKRFKAILPEGVTIKNIDLERFNKLPLILINHEWKTPFIGNATDIKLSNRGFYFKPYFNKNTDQSKKINELVERGLITKGYPGGHIERDKDGNITKFNIYEISICP